MIGRIQCLRPDVVIWMGDVVILSLLKVVEIGGELDDGMSGIKTVYSTGGEEWECGCGGRSLCFTKDGSSWLLDISII